jgi:hypothetical protein
MSTSAKADMQPVVSKEDKSKTKGQRVMDAVEILRNIKGVGITEDAIGYADVKAKLDEWIQTGDAWSGKIDFPRYGRFAEIILPWRADRKCTCVLRATPELKRQWQENK